MNNLAKLRSEVLNLSSNAVCLSMGDPAPISVRTYNAIEKGDRDPTIQEATTILALFNANCTEMGKKKFVLTDLFPGS